MLIALAGYIHCAIYPGNVTFFRPLKCYRKWWNLSLKKFLRNIYSAKNCVSRSQGNYNTTIVPASPSIFVAPIHNTVDIAKVMNWTNTCNVLRRWHAHYLLFDHSQSPPFLRRWHVHYLLFDHSQSTPSTCLGQLLDQIINVTSTIILPM